MGQVAIKMISNILPCEKLVKKYKKALHLRIILILIGLNILLHVGAELALHDVDEGVV
jgi:hypothetical protein